MVGPTRPDNLRLFIAVFLIVSAVCSYGAYYYATEYLDEYEHQGDSYEEMDEEGNVEEQDDEEESEEDDVTMFDLEDADIMLELHKDGGVYEYVYADVETGKSQQVFSSVDGDQLFRMVMPYKHGQSLFNTFSLSSNRYPLQDKHIAIGPTSEPTAYDRNFRKMTAYAYAGEVLQGLPYVDVARDKIYFKSHQRDAQLYSEREQSELKVYDIATKETAAITSLEGSLFSGFVLEGVLPNGGLVLTQRGGDGGCQNRAVYYINEDNTLHTTDDASWCWQGYPEGDEKVVRIIGDVHPASGTYVFTTFELTDADTLVESVYVGSIDGDRQRLLLSFTHPTEDISHQFESTVKNVWLGETAILVQKRNEGVQELSVYDTATFAHKKTIPFVGPEWISDATWDDDQQTFTYVSTGDGKIAATAVSLVEATEVTLFEDESFGGGYRHIRLVDLPKE